MLDKVDKLLISAIQNGLPLTARPYNEIAKQINQTEAEVISRINHLKGNGTIKRLGVVVKHRALGFKANAMVVWNIPDAQTRKIAQQLAGFDCVTLCYQRPRRLPDWPYNLFTMIHGKDRDTVLQRLEDIIEILELHDIVHESLFSTKQFKQRGGHYISDPVSTNNVIDFAQQQNRKTKALAQTLSKTREKQLLSPSPLLKPLYG